MYVVKVGEYYVRAHETLRFAIGGVHIGDIVLSKEIMTSFSKELAEKLAKKLNGEVIEIGEEVTND